MNKLKLTKLISSTLVIASVLALNTVSASAEWKDDSTGRWYSEGDSWVVGWRHIDADTYYFDKDGYMKKGWIQDGGNWYYLNDNGTMAKDKYVNGWYLNMDGVGKECIKVDGFEIDKSTGTIAKFTRSDAFGRPGDSGVPLIIPKEIGGIEIKRIGRLAFDRCSNLTSVVIPDSVTSIGDNAFDACGKLTSITIPNSVTSMGNGVFEGCSRVTSITIPNGVTTIGNWAFFNCTSLTSITVPKSVTSIGKYAFSGTGDNGCKNAIFYVESENTKQLLIDYGISVNRIILSSESQTAAQ